MASFPEPVRGLTSREFDKIRSLAREVFGLDLRPGKEELVNARLGKRIRAMNLNSFEEYYQSVLEDRSGERLADFVDALATNHTSFFREAVHFDFLRKIYAPFARSREPFRVWSSACSTGEEPYTIAVTLLEECGTLATNARIVASDISRKALNIAQRAIYPEQRVKELPQECLRKYLLYGTGEWNGSYRFKPQVRGMIEFRRQNLMEDFTSLGQFRVIFCRNVMIYFDKATQERLVQRMASLLEPGGYLFIGHAESLMGVTHPLKYVKPAIYQQPERLGGGRH